MGHDRVTEMLALAKSAAADARRAEKVLHEDKAKLAPFMLGKPSPLPPPEPPQLADEALAYQQMAELRSLMGDRSPVAYNRAATEQLEALVAKIKALAELDEDAHQAIGMRLHVLKRRMPPGIKWGDYLSDLGMPWGASRADDYIRVFLGKTTALKLKEKAASRGRKHRAKAPLRNGEPPVETKGDSGSACDINWENHREDDTETDAQVRARAVEWQLHEAIRLAEEFALLRPGTRASEIKITTIRRVGTVITAWRNLQAKLRKTRR